MKHLVFYTIAIFLVWNNCHGQTGQKEDEKAHKKNMPESNISVNKEYDENGNIIRYDSTYSWSYSSSESDSLLNDTLFFGDKRFFDRKNLFPDVPFFGDDFFNFRFLNDSIFSDRSFSDEFFDKKFFSDKFFNDRVSSDSSFFRSPSIKHFPPDQFNMNRDYMEKMFRELDSLQNEFFRKH
jgi:hypothetical protein